MHAQDLETDEQKCAQVAVLLNTASGIVGRLVHLLKNPTLSPHTVQTEAQVSQIM